MDRLTRTEQLILNAIKNGRGSYTDLTDLLYKRETDIWAINTIRVHICRIRKKGYNLVAIDNWGYKEGTDEKEL